MGKLGVYFGTEKQAALLRGDTSNAVINRYFVYGFQAIGMYFCGTPDGSPAMVHLQARYAQKAWESLIEISRTGDQKLRAQGLLLFVHALIVMGLTRTAPFYLLKACEIVNRCDLKFTPTDGCSSELSEQVREDAAVLSGELFLLSAGWVGAGNDCKDRKGVSAGPPGENHPTIFRYRTQSEFRNSV